jgi:hypothetical protein
MAGERERAMADVTGSRALDVHLPRQLRQPTLASSPRRRQAPAITSSLGCYSLTCKSATQADLNRVRQNTWSGICQITEAKLPIYPF